MAYLILNTLQHLSADQVGTIVLELIGSRNGEAFPDHVVEELLMPILDRISSEMQEVCTSDCYRFFALDRHIFHTAEVPVPTYWHRFMKEGLSDASEPRSYARLEHTTEPCKVGFEVGHERSCPLYQVEPQLDNVTEFLAIIERVSKFRLAQARPAWAATSPNKSC